MYNSKRLRGFSLLGSIVIGVITVFAPVLSDTAVALAMVNSQHDEDFYIRQFQDIALQKPALSKHSINVVGTSGRIDRGVYGLGAWSWLTPNFDIEFDLYKIPLNDVDGDVIPDIVENAGDYLEAAWSQYQSMGYRTPRGAEYLRYVVYFDWLSAGTLGTTTGLEWNGSYVGSYMKLATSLSDAGLRSTTAHELFHAVQWAYFPPYLEDSIADYLYGTGRRWWAEATASWAQGVVWPNTILDLDVQRAQDYLDTPDISLFMTGNGRDYESYLFAEFLAESVDRDIIRRSWEYATQTLLTNPYRGIDMALSSYGKSGIESFREFAVWNYFTGDYAYPRYQKQSYRRATYYKSTNYPSVWIRQKHYSYPVRYNANSIADDPQSGASNYIEFYPASPANESLNISFVVPSTSDATVVWVEIGKDRSVKTNSLNVQRGVQSNILVKQFGLLEKVVLIPIHLVSDSSALNILGMPYIYTAEIGTSTVPVNNPSGSSNQTGPYQYLWKAQNGTISADQTAHEITASRGDTIAMSVTLVNRSGRVIKGLSSLPTVAGKINYGGWGLGTSKPIDNKPTWLDASSFVVNGNRFVYYEGADIPDGGEFTLTWNIKISATATKGTYKMYLNCVKEWENWTQQVSRDGILLPSPDIFWRVYVN